MNGLMINCKKAGELIEKKHLFGISFYESIQLLFHNSICTACKRYKQQSEFLEKLFQMEHFSYEKYYSLDEKTVERAIHKFLKK